MRKNFLLLTSIFFVLVKVSPQSISRSGKDQRPQFQVRIASFSGMGAVKLRWSVAGFSAWQEANRYGYVIERYTVSRDGRLLPKPEKQLLTAQPLRPLPEEQWQEAAKADDYAGALASALYDTGFALENKQSPAAMLVSRLTVSEQRYAVAMLSADMSYGAAQMAGLAYTDSSAQKGEKYLYRLYVKVPRSVRTDTVSVFTGLDDYRPLPQPEDVLAVFGDRQVMLSWDYKNRERYYSAYVVEKSTDGGQTFTPITNRPVIPFTSNATDSTRANTLIYFPDTLVQNDIPVQYRIKGISLFGEESPYSAIASGSGKTEVPATPGITAAEPLANNRVKISWDFDPAADTLLRSFSIASAATAQGPYAVVVADLPPQTRTYQLETGGQSGYYMVTATTRYGTAKNSFPYLVQPEDNTPPAAVQGFAGSIDSTGVVTLNWQPNTEKDLAGYKLYKTMRQDDEYAVLTDTLYTATHFTDTLSLGLLNSKVWYNIVALDNRANASSMPAPLVIHKPDRAAPTPPVLRSYTITSKGISLYWHRSHNEDVAVQYLLRRQEGKYKWDTLAVITDLHTEQYTDTTAAPAGTYEYILICRDETGLASTPSPSYRLTAADKDAQKIVLKVAAAANREERKISINWNYAAVPIKQFELYRGEGKIPMSLYKVFENGETTFADTDLKVNNLYTYAIRAVLPDGKYTDLKTVTINY